MPLDVAALALSVFFPVMPFTMTMCVCVCVLNCDCFSDFLSLFSLRTLRRPGLLPSHSLTDSSALCHRTCRLLSSVQFSSVAFCLPSRADRFAGRAAKLSLQRRLACLLSFFYFFFVLSLTSSTFCLSPTSGIHTHTHTHALVFSAFHFDYLL